MNKRFWLLTLLMLSTPVVSYAWYRGYYPGWRTGWGWGGYWGNPYWGTFGSPWYYPRRSKTIILEQPAAQQPIAEQKARTHTSRLKKEVRRLEDQVYDLRMQLQAIKQAKMQKFYAQQLAHNKEHIKTK